MAKFSLKQKIRSWLFEDESDRPEVIRADSDHQVSLDSNPIRLHIYPASGGTIVETRTYDPIKDRSNTNLYVINDSSEIGEELAKIITMTSLSR